MTYNINLQHLKVVAAIEKEGSMTKAADALFLTQSALSHHVKELERIIGHQIFERRNKKLWLTELGTQILNSATIINKELNILTNQINRIGSGDIGTIRLSTACYTTYTWLPKLVKSFNKEYPNLKIKVVTDATTRITEFLNNGLLDVAISSREKIVDTRLQYSTLFKDNLVVIMHKYNPLAKLKSIKPKEFEGQTLLTFDYDDDDLDILRYILKPAGVQLAEIIKMPLSEVIIEMVKANFGITVMAKWLVTPLLTKELVTIPLIHPKASRTWHLITFKNQSKAIEIFKDFAMENLKNH
jgi:LysR family transcriptional regulator, regulator for metE and metH